jgi:hypothetical protein
MMTDRERGRSYATVAPRVWRKLGTKRIWRRIAVERVAEPLHLNLAAVPVAAFGGFRAKVAFDLVWRQHHAYALLKQADVARAAGISRLTILEFGVASGMGLVNMADVAERVARETGVEFAIYGFDTGAGMPDPLDYRDHPEVYGAGDFPMDVRALESRLPSNVGLIVGDIAETVPQFVERLDPRAPIAFASVDVDYYSSARHALKVLLGPPDSYLPVTLLYLDDVMRPSHNSWCGELLAVAEFNSGQTLRKIEPMRFLRSTRLFKAPPWIDQMYALHVLDHPARQPETAPRVPTRRL